MKRHLSISISIALSAVILAAMLSQRSVSAGPDNRGQKLVEQARAALGGDAKLKSVQALSATGTFRRVLGKEMPEMSGEIQLELLFPDKYMTTEVADLPMAGAQITRISGFNGDQQFRDMKTSGGVGNVVVRMGSNPDTPEAQAAQLKALRADFARYVIALLAAPPPTQTVDFVYAGEAQAEDGRADAIDAKGADGLAMRLFLDQTSHRPLMITYSDAAPKFVVRTHAGMSREEAEKLAKEGHEGISKEMEGKPAEPKMADFQIYLADYRNVDGIFFPHHITKAVNGEVNEEWQITKFKVNPPLKAEKFKK